MGAIGHAPLLGGQSLARAQQGQRAERDGRRRGRELQPRAEAERADQRLQLG
jgi:hypothetical protein